MDIGRWKSECQYVGFLADQVSHYADRFAEGRIDQKAMDYAMNELCAAACELKRIAAMDRPPCAFGVGVTVPLNTTAGENQ